MRKLSPKLEEWLRGYNKLVQKLLASGFKPTSTNAREGLANLTYTLVTKKPALRWVQDDLVEGGDFSVPVRIYHPQPEAKLPVLVYFHGGGHMAGSVSVYDPICRKIAKTAQHVVVAPDYRLAPECPYPAGINDGLTVIHNLWKTLAKREVNYLPELSMAGDSAGGAICATVSHTLQNILDIEINKQILIYPSLDYTMQAKSILQNGKGYLLEKDKIAWYFDNYFKGDEDRKNYSPLFMEFTKRLPETLVVTAEFCPLRDEGFAYLKELKEVGIAGTHLHYDDMIHAFMNMEDITPKQCKRLYAEMGDFLAS